MSIIRKCELIGTENRFGVTKDYTCTRLPIKFIIKPIGEWMCSNCAFNILKGRGLRPTIEEEG